MLKKNKTIGQILKEDQLITEEVLVKALEEQRKTKARLGEILLAGKYISEYDLAFALSKQLDIPLVTWESKLLIPKEEQGLHKLIPESFARQQLVLPLSRELNILTVAFFDPLNLIVFDNLRSLTRCTINPVIATKTDMEKAIEAYYSRLDQFEKLVRNLEAGEDNLEEIDLTQQQIQLSDAIVKAEEAPVIKLVNMLILQAIRERASDIHIEPYFKQVRLRYRIDGVLYDIPSPSWNLYFPIVSRIKILSKLDIAEKRLPQDGSFHLKMEERIIDIRTSTMPTIWGEKVVLRILDKGNNVLTLADLGFEQQELLVFQKAIQRPYGLIFLTGPTGSGKTTTLYAALMEVRSPKKNILTIEDPVEYKIEGINQVEVNPFIGFTFAEGLRHTLRQDPDIIMVGEVRDLETAEICVRSSLTGHIVFSTLHTNDAPSAITRLVDVGIPPFLVASSVNMIVAQRLVRKLCEKCKEEYTPPERFMRDLKQLSLHARHVYRPKGCKYCRGTGYMGRVAIFEILTINEEIREMIVKRKTEDEIKKVALGAEMKSLFVAAMSKVNEGVTSLEEAYTVTYGEL